jgi:hypothetical protein
MLMRPKHSPDRLLKPKASGVYDLGSFKAQPAEEMRGERWDAPGARPGHELFIALLPPAELQSRD